MPPHRSSDELLVLHAVRLLGFADDGRLASRFALDRETVTELLGDFEALGWVARSGFAGTSGWALTDAGRAQDSLLLAQELDSSGARQAVERANAAFEPLNARFLEAVTRWQVLPVPGDPLAANDHSDPRWDDRVIGALVDLAAPLRPVCAELAGALARFEGYDARYAAAVGRARAGQTRWIEGLGIDSCHSVWMQLHEDLLATLGMERG